jgi:hypothetical protein
MKINPIDYINHSGGAVGADSTFDLLGKLRGFKNHNHYYHGTKTPLGNVEITDEQLEEGWKHVLLANKTLLRKPDAYKDLLSRNWFQVKNADAIYAIGEISMSWQGINGGTGWAVQMAIDVFKPVYVFDQKIGLWCCYDYQNKIFDVCKSPILTRNYAGIGTRKINDVGKKAIGKLYDDTIKFTNEDASEIITSIGRSKIQEILVAWDNYRYKMIGTGKDARHDDFMDTLCKNTDSI